MQLLVLTAGSPAIPLELQELWSVPGGPAVATNQLLYNIARRGIQRSGVRFSAVWILDSEA